MVFPAALTNLIPQNLDFGGGFGLLAILAVVFPYIERLVLFFFKFNITENVGALFHESRMLGRLLGGNSVLGTTVGLVGTGQSSLFCRKSGTTSKSSTRNTSPSLWKFLAVIQVTGIFWNGFTKSKSRLRKS